MVKAGECALPAKLSGKTLGICVIIYLSVLASTSEAFSGKLKTNTEENPTDRLTLTAGKSWRYQEISGVAVGLSGLPWLLDSQANSCGGPPSIDPKYPG